MNQIILDSIQIQPDPPIWHTYVAGEAFLPAHRLHRKFGPPSLSEVGDRYTFFLGGGEEGNWARCLCYQNVFGPAKPALTYPTSDSLVDRQSVRDRTAVSPSLHQRRDHSPPLGHGKVDESHPSSSISESPLVSARESLSSPFSRILFVLISPSFVSWRFFWYTMKAQKPITSPVPISWYPTLSVLMLAIGLVIAASFFV